jgi:uncharacterized protein involved in exopolysaccharide biosynthesis
MKKTEDYIREFITILFMRRKTILLITMLFAIGAILLVFFWPATYTAKGSILVKSNRVLKSPESLEKVHLNIRKIGEYDVYSEMQLLKSTNVIERTIHHLHEKKLIFSDEEDITSKEKAIIAKIMSNLRIELAPKSYVLDVFLNWGDPQKAEIVLDTLMSQYISYRKEIYNPSEAETFFEQQLSRFSTQIEEAETRLIKLSRKSNSLSPIQSIDNNLAVERDLKRQLNTLHAELLDKRNSIRYLEDALASQETAFFGSIENEGIIASFKELQKLIIERAELLAVYHSGARRVRAIDEQIKNITKYLRAEVRGLIKDYRSKCKSIESQIADMEARLGDIATKNILLYSNSIELDRINRDKELLEESYNTFAKRLEEARIDNTTEANRLFWVSIVSKARASTAPVFPNKKVVIPLGVLLGFISGCTIGFLFEFFDHTFKRPEDVSNYTDLPHIYSIPRWQKV